MNTQSAKGMEPAPSPDEDRRASPHAGEVEPAAPEGERADATAPGRYEWEPGLEASEPSSPDDATSPAVEGPATARGPRRRRWVVPVATVGAFLLGIGAGGASTDPTSSKEYLAVVAERDEAQDAIRGAALRATAAESRARQADDDAEARESELDLREAALDTREQALEARESAVTETERREAANRVGNGMWTVGVDIEPGTYRTTEAVGDLCYWGIYRTGSNGGDIIENDIVDGGFPTVTLSAGQDFKSSDCGTWSKQ